MTAGECLQNKWFYMKYIGKYLNVEILFVNVYIMVLFLIFGQ